MVEKKHSYKCRLRCAGIFDADILFEWANDESVRKNSFSTDKIVYSNHIAWYKRQLERENVRIFIAMVDDYVVGTLRLTRSETGTAVISYTVAPNYRAMGIGKAILMLAEQECCNEQFADVLLGEVKKHNIASQKIFEQLSYKKEELDGCYVYTKIPQFHVDEVELPKFAGGIN